jgi:hypothetical protein
LSRGGAGATSLIMTLNPPKREQRPKYLQGIRDCDQPIVVQIDQQEPPFYRAEVHDFYGAERFGIDWRKPYFENAKVIIVILSITDDLEEQKDIVTTWIQRYADPDAITIGLINKLDLISFPISYDFEKKMGFKCFEISIYWPNVKEILWKTIWYGISQYFQTNCL